MSDAKTAILKKALGEGGAFFDGSHGSNGGNAAGERLYDVLLAVVSGLKNRVDNGLMVAAPTTPSTQATGAGGVATVNVNIDKGVVDVNGTKHEFAAAADTAIVTATALWSATSGKSLIIALVVKLAADGTFSVVPVVGAEAATGSQVAPGQAAIQAAVGAGLHWVKLCEVTVNRTGATTITQTQDNSKADYGGGLVTVE